MKILVTGGAGFIGSHLAEKLLQSNHKVVILDNINNYYNPEFKRNNIQEIIENTDNKSKNNLTIVIDDIKNKKRLKQLFMKHNFQKIIHLAGSVGVRNSILYPDIYVKNNIEGTLNLLSNAVRYGVRQFIFISSSSVYGNLSPTPFKENKTVDFPLNPYAYTKKGAELLCYIYHKTYGINITVFRLFTVFGPRGRPDMAPYLFTNAIFNGKEIQLFNNGLMWRDFTYIDDVVRGISVGLEKEFSFEIFNLGSSTPIKITEFIKLIEKIIGKKAIVKTYANIEKAKKMLNFNPKIDIKTGMEIFIEWFKKTRILQE
jgi:UDP-glucuronate 4-epimerase